MGDEPQDSKVTTESSQAVLKAVAGRLAKIDAGEMTAIQYVGPDGTSRQAVNHTGQVAAVPGATSPTAPPPAAPRSQPAAAPRPQPQPARRSGPPTAPSSQPQPQAAPAVEIDVRLDQRPPPPAPSAQQAARSAESDAPTTEPTRGSWWSRLLHKLGIR